MDDENECPICMESYNRSDGDDSLRRLKDGLVNTCLPNPDNCKHFICEFCCDKLSESHKRCPICRADWSEFIDRRMENFEYCEYCGCEDCDNVDCYHERCLESNEYYNSLYHYDISG
jgi:hypothetical protein